MTDVTFVDDCLVYKWQLLKRDLHQMNIQPTQKMTFLIGRTKILRSQFQDPGGQYVLISGWICKVRLQ